MRCPILRLAIVNDLSVGDERLKLADYGRSAPEGSLALGQRSKGKGPSARQLPRFRSAICFQSLTL